MVATNQEVKIDAKNLIAFEFYESDHSYYYYTPQTVSPIEKISPANYYEAYDDTIFLHNIENEKKTSLSYAYEFDNKNNQLILTDKNNKEGLPYKYYLKKSKELPISPGRLSEYFNEKQLIGIWVEYKSEVIGDTNILDYTFNGNLLREPFSYHFYDDATFTINSQNTDFYDRYFELTNDTLTIIDIRRHCDCNTTPNETKYIYRFNSPDEMSISDLVTGDMFGKTVYFKRSKKSVKQTLDEYERTDEDAQFPGGNAALRKFILENADSTLFRKSEKSPFDYLPLIISVDESGKVYDAIIFGNTSKKEAKEAVRLAKLMPDWIPAKSWQLNNPDINSKAKAVKSEVYLRYYNH